MKKILVLLLCLGLVGCATMKIGGFQKDALETHNFREVFNYPGKQVLDACIQAVKNKSNLIGPIFGEKVGILGIVIEGDNPTTIGIVKINSGVFNEDFNRTILNEVRRLLKAK